MDFTLTLTVPFQTEKQAKIACETVSPDPELRPNDFNHSYSVENTNFIADFEAVSARNLRVGVNSFMESLALILETMDTLGPETYE